MHKTAFEPSYTGMTADGAQWLVASMYIAKTEYLVLTRMSGLFHIPSQVDHTEVRLVGIDYMSIALFADLAGAHDVLLPKVHYASWTVLFTTFHCCNHATA